jgi:hypothetical protein
MKNTTNNKLEFNLIREDNELFDDGKHYGDLILTINRDSKPIGYINIVDKYTINESNWDMNQLHDMFEELVNEINNTLK